MGAGAETVGRDDMLSAGLRLLGEARALRAAFPCPVAMNEVSFSRPTPGAGHEAVRAAMVYLLDEMVLVRNGKSDTLTVLDDEIANTESLLARL
jgi:hypothetical protein